MPFAQELTASRPWTMSTYHQAISPTAVRADWRATSRRARASILAGTGLLDGVAGGDGTGVLGGPARGQPEDRGDEEVDREESQVGDDAVDEWAGLPAWAFAPDDIGEVDGDIGCGEQREKRRPGRGPSVAIPMHGGLTNPP